MNKPVVWIGILFVVLVLGFMLNSTLNVARYRCEVCIAFNGRSDCRTARAQTREGAIRTATENACAQLASGVTESSQCELTPPASVRWIE